MTLAPAIYSASREFSELFASKGIYATRGHNEMVFCPWHEDHKKPSLSVDWDGGRFHCFVGGCPANPGGGVRALRDLMDVASPLYIPNREMRRPKASSRTAGAQVSADDWKAAAVGMLAEPGPTPKAFQVGLTIYDQIRDITGALHAIHQRKNMSDGTKRIAWYRAWEDPSGRISKSFGLDGRKIGTLPLFGTETLAGITPGSLVFLCEGEHAARDLHARGIPAVATVCGAGTTHDAAAYRVLDGCIVALWPDNDEAGVLHMKANGALLHGHAMRVIMLPPMGGKGDDAADWLPRHTDEDLIALLKQHVDGWLPEGATELAAVAGEKAADYADARATRNRRFGRAAAQKPKMIEAFEKSNMRWISEAIRKCRTEIVAGICTGKDAHHLAHYIACKNALCPDCGPGRMSADLERKLEKVEGLEHVRFNGYALTPKEPVPADEHSIKLLRDRLHTLRGRRGDLPGGLYGAAWSPTHGAVLYLAVQDSVGMGDEYGSFNVRKMNEAPMRSGELCGWLEDVFFNELEDVFTGDCDYARLVHFTMAIKARKRFTTFGTLFQHPTDPSCVPEETVGTQLGSDEIKFGGISGGAYARQKGAKDHPCPHPGCEGFIAYKGGQRLPAYRVSRAPEGYLTWLH